MNCNGNIKTRTAKPIKNTKPVHKCSQPGCSKSFKTRLTLLKHLTQDHAIKPYKCDLCPKSFTYMLNLKQHKTFHAQTQTYKCAQCGDKSFSSYNKLRLHFNRHKNVVSPRTKTYCSFCKEKFANENLYKKHVLLKHRQSVFVCEICGLKLIDKESFKHHISTHKNADKIYTCKHCNKNFKQSFTLKNHILRIHEDGMYNWVCDVCGKTLQTKYGFDLHMKVHSGIKDIKCPQCEKTFSDRNYLYAHLRTHTGIRPFQCKVCGNQFTQKSSLNTHFKKKHSGEKSIVKKRTKIFRLNKDIADRIYSCKECDKSFSRIVYLKGHVKRVHEKIKYARDWVCDTCGKVLQSKTAFDIHMKMHSGIKNVKCPHCEKTFFSNSYLRIHLRTHTGERPYSCEECGKKFSQKSSINVHLRIHTGERPYICHICDTGYICNAALKSHLKQEHQS